tara:strand:- start:139 stop:561 length:423 start_codon:yes stop_codon:yes gene_type:complete
MLSFKIFAAENGKWTFTKEENYCYISSTPLKEEGDYTKRGDAYILVYRINKTPEKIVQITAGYNYDTKKPVVVKIDGTNFEFFSSEDTAFIKDKDKEVIYAMQKGMDLVVKGYSFKGTLTTDTYTLKGFTAANNKLSKDC